MEDISEKGDNSGVELFRLLFSVSGEDEET